VFSLFADLPEQLAPGDTTQSVNGPVWTEQKAQLFARYALRHEPTTSVEVVMGPKRSVCFRVSNSGADVPPSSGDVI
jgi:hypothetical protein